MVHLLLANDMFIIKGGFRGRKERLKSHIKKTKRGESAGGTLQFGVRITMRLRTLIYLHLIHPEIG